MRRLCSASDRPAQRLATLRRDDELIVHPAPFYLKPLLTDSAYLGRCLLVSDSEI